MTDTPTAVASAPASGGTDTGSSSSAASAPTTFAEAFAREDSPASQTPDASSTTPPDAADPAQAQGSPQQDDVRSPFIPRSRFDEVNNALKDLKAWKEQRAWADQIQPETFREMQAWFQRAAQDPIAFTQQMIADLNADPVHSQALRSLAAKALAAGRQQAAVTMPDPDVQITDGNGNVIGMTYSDKAQAARDAYLVQQVLAKVDEKYAPVVKTHAEIAADRERLQRETAATQFASGFAKELSTYPGFTEHKQAIGQEVARMLQQYPDTDPRTDDPTFLEAVTLRAYNKVVVPTLTAKGESSMLDSLKRKAAASTSVNPGSAAPSSPRGVTSFHDKSLQW